MVDLAPSSPHHPLVVAHRGDSDGYPENTLAAFAAAIAQGADAVELDVRLTADGVPVVLHDADVGVVSDGRGPVHRLTLAEVKRLRVRGEEIPTLAEVLGLIAGRVVLDVEIKNLPGEEAFDSPREAVAEAVVATLRAEAYAGPVLASSFNWLAIERIRDIEPSIETGFLTISAIDPRAALVYARSHGHGYVLPNVEALLTSGAAFVEEAHGSGVKVGTWTVDEEDRLRTLFGWGVDAVASNRPGTALRIRDEVLEAEGRVP